MLLQKKSLVWYSDDYKRQYKIINIINRYIHDNYTEPIANLIHSDNCIDFGTVQIQ